MGALIDGIHDALGDDASASNAVVVEYRYREDARHGRHESHESGDERAVSSQLVDVEVAIVIDPVRRIVGRGERIHEDSSGMISILGGKLTTYRCMAKRVVDLAAKRLQKTGAPCRTHELSLFPGEAPGPIPALDSPLEAAFGSEAEQVRSLAGEDASLAPSLYSLRFERAATLADLLLRRSRLGVLNWEEAQALAPRLATALAGETGWDPDQELARLEKERP